MKKLKLNLSTTDDLVDAVNRTLPTDAMDLFKQHSLGEVSMTYIVSGDSNRSNNFNNMIDYYNILLGQIGISVIDNARSGQSGDNWLNNTISPTLDEAIAATPGTGATTLLEYSFGPNDRGTNTEIKAALKGGIEAYLAAKPDATVVLCPPTRTSGKYGTLIALYEEIATELELQLIKAHPVMEPFDTDPRFKQDSVHLNNYGSQRLLHFILSNIIPDNVRSSIMIPDLGIITPPDASMTAVVKSGYWNYSDGVYKTNDTWRCTDPMDVEPNYTLHVDHGGNTDKVYWYDTNGDFMHAEAMTPDDVSGFNVVVPAGAYGMTLNISNDGETYDALDYDVQVAYVIEEQTYMSPEEVNEGMAIGMPRGERVILDSKGQTGSKGQVLVALGLGKTEWQTPLSPIACGWEPPAATPQPHQVMYTQLLAQGVNVYYNVNGVWMTRSAS